MLEDVLDKEAGPKPKLVAQPAGVASPTSVSPTSGSPIAGSAISVPPTSGSGIRHIPQADLDAYINGQLSGPRLDFCRTHLDSCVECRAGLEDLRNFKNSQAGRSMGGSLKREMDRRKRQKQIKAAATAVAVAAVVAAVAAVGWYEVVEPRLHAAAVVASGVSAAPAQNVVQAASTGRPTSQAAGASAAAPAASPTRVAPVASPTSTAQGASPTRAASASSLARVATSADPTPVARAAGPAAAASTAAATSATATAEAAPAGSTTFALLGPFGDEISDDRPEFTWQPLAGTAKYAVILVDEGLRPIAHVRVKTTSWRPKKPLRRGRTYLWQVTAILHNGTKVIGTGPTSVEARIHVLPPSGVKHSDK